MKRAKAWAASIVFAVIFAFGLVSVTTTLAFAGVPTVDTVTPSGLNAPFQGDIVITFSEEMNPNVSGYVALTGGAADMGVTASWDATDTVYTIGYRGLDPNTTYTVEVSGFSSTTDDLMLTDDTNTFTTYATAVCSIGSDLYGSLQDALAAAQTGDTIKLLTNITEATPVNVNGTSLTIDLVGYNLDLDGKDVSVTDGSLAINNGGTVTVGMGVYAENSTLAVNANIDSGQYGISAIDGSTVTVKGNISSSVDGIYASDENTKVTMTGNIMVSGSNANDGVKACDGATVSVKGKISARWAIEVYSSYNDLPTTVTLDGNITTDWKGIFAGGVGNVVNVTGSITSDYNGIEAYSGAQVTMTGNITCANNDADPTYDYFGVDSENDGTIVTLNGNISMTAISTTGVLSYGVYAYDNGKAFINGSIVTVGQDSVGAYADHGGQATIEGTITAPTYVGLYDHSSTLGWVNVFLTQAEHDATSEKPGYLQYSRTPDPGYGSYTSYIWVKVPGSPTPLPGGGSNIPAAGDTHGLAGLVALFALAALGASGAVLASRRIRKGNSPRP
ncbi:MAG: Ig-like domain-containing protein [Eggerthellaceae bacterium]|nr:Ig-like domain-containing protein [Eggerthellaceae bacterium]